MKILDAPRPICTPRFSSFIFERPLPAEREDVQALCHRGKYKAHKVPDHFFQPLSSVQFQPDNVLPAKMTGFRSHPSKRFTSALPAVPGESFAVPPDFLHIAAHSAYLQPDYFYPLPFPKRAHKPHSPG